MADIRCPKCKRKLAEVTKNNFIRHEHKIQKMESFSCTALNGELYFVCPCGKWRGLFTVENRWVKDCVFSFV